MTSRFNGEPLPSLRISVLRAPSPALLPDSTIVKPLFCFRPTESTPRANVPPIPVAADRAGRRPPPGCRRPRARGVSGAGVRFRTHERRPSLQRPHPTGRRRGDGIGLRDWRYGWEGRRGCQRRIGCPAVSPRLLPAWVGLRRIPFVRRSGMSFALRGYRRRDHRPDAACGAIASHRRAGPGRRPFSANDGQPTAAVPIPPVPTSAPFLDARLGLRASDDKSVRPRG